MRMNVEPRGKSMPVNQWIGELLGAGAALPEVAPRAASI